MRARTVLFALVFLTSCRTVAPWDAAPKASEINLSIVVRNNLLFLPSARIDNRTGAFLFSSAAARSVLDPRFAAGTPRGSHLLLINEKELLRITPVVIDLQGTADAMIGADAFARGAVTIDYVSGLLTYQKEGIHPGLMTLFHYRGEPAVEVTVGGTTVSAIVDTASPDTLTLPGSGGRRAARVALAGSVFDALDVRYADVARARIGNRLLSKFLVTIDYGRQTVGLWRDPRSGG